jgi:hypothetical protein
MLPTGCQACTLLAQVLLTWHKNTQFPESILTLLSRDKQKDDPKISRLILAAGISIHSRLNRTTFLGRPILAPHLLVNVKVGCQPIRLGFGYQWAARQNRGGRRGIEAERG